MSDLSREFAADHRHLTQGLYAIKEALEREDLEAASRLADELDRRVGPHMEFEEGVLYPALEEHLGSEFVRRLYGEHEEGVEAVRSLQGAKGTALAALDRERILAQVDTALKHALSCGTLLSRVRGLTAEEEEAMLERLRALRTGGRRWTEL